MPIIRPKIVQFPVGATWSTALDAFNAAETYRQSCVAAGNDWAEPGWPGAGPLYKQPGGVDAPAAGMYINKFTPTPPIPEGAAVVEFAAAEWVLA